MFVIARVAVVLPEMGRLHHKCNQLRLLLTFMSMITSKVEPRFNAVVGVHVVSEARKVFPYLLPGHY